MIMICLNKKKKILKMVQPWQGHVLSENFFWMCYYVLGCHSFKKGPLILYALDLAITIFQLRL